MHGICVFGDSITFGRGEHNHSGWCGRLKQQFESKHFYNCLFNLGICGETSTHLLERIDVEAQSRIVNQRPEDRNVIIIAIGTNDSRLVGEGAQKTPETDPTTFESNIKSLIQISQKHTNEIYVIGLTPVNEKLTHDYEHSSFSNERVTQYNEIIKAACQAANIDFLDIFEQMSQVNYEQLLDDGLHPNAEGYEKMYELIHVFLEKHGVLEHQEEQSFS